MLYPAYISKNFKRAGSWETKAVNQGLLIYKAMQHWHRSMGTLAKKNSDMHPLILTHSKSHILAKEERILEVLPT